MDKVSIIVPIYNVAPYLDRCILSLLSQTYPNIEIILVNDGSTDGSAAICDLYTTLDKRVRVLHQENQGLSAARNAGMANATGHYLAFVDSDDFVSSQYVQTLFQALINNDADMSICSCAKLIPDQHGPRAEEGELMEAYAIREGVLSPKEALTACARTGETKWVIAVNKLYRRKLFEGLEYPIGCFHEDEYVMHHIFLRCRRIACVSEALYFYMVRQGSIMGSRNDPRRLDGMEARLLRARDYIALEGYVPLALLTFRRVLHELHNYYSQPGFQPSAEHYRRSIALQKLAEEVALQLQTHDASADELCQMTFRHVL